MIVSRSTCDEQRTGSDGYAVHLFAQPHDVLLPVIYFLSTERSGSPASCLQPFLLPPVLVKGGGLSKIAWAFLRPLGARGECNVGVRNGDHSTSSNSSVQNKG